MQKYTISVQYTGDKPIDQEQLTRLVMESLLGAKQEKTPPSALLETTREEITIV